MSSLADTQVRPQFTNRLRVGNDGEGKSLIGQVLSRRIDRIYSGAHTGLKELGPVIGDGGEFLERNEFRFGGLEFGFGFFDAVAFAGGDTPQIFKVVHDEFRDLRVKDLRLDRSGFRAGSGREVSAAPIVNGFFGAADSHSHGTSATKHLSAKQCLVERTVGSRRSGLMGLGGLPCGPINQRFMCVQVLDSALSGDTEIRRVFQQVPDGGVKERTVQTRLDEPGKVTQPVAGDPAKEDFPDNGGGSRVGFQPSVFAFPIPQWHHRGNVNAPGDGVGFGVLKALGLNFSLVLRDGEHDVALHPTGRSCRVHLFARGSEQAPAAFDAFKQLKGMPEAAGEPVSLPHNQAFDLTAFDAFNAVKENGAGVVTPGHVKFVREHFDGMVFDGSPLLNRRFLEFRADEGFGAVTDPGHADVAEEPSHRCVSISNSKGTSFSATSANGPAVRQNTQALDDEGKDFTVSGSIQTKPNIEGCKRCADAGFPTRGKCAYCDTPLSSRHEHDHYPIPARHGGDKTVPTCLNCHDLKDRLSLDAWPVEAYEEAISKAPPMVRILYAKTLALVADVLADMPEEEA